jgi:hypothetical protein
MEVRTFSPKARERLKYYVYLYRDPRTERPFYVGKGTGNRCFAHLKAAGESATGRVIRELRKLGRSPRIEILKYGLTEEEAYLVEATAIDLLGCETLTNAVRGHGMRYGICGTVAEIAAVLAAKPARINDPVVLVNISNSYHPSMDLQALYDVTRCAWKVGANRSKARYALSVYRGIVREVFAIAAWLPGSSTMRACDADGHPRHPPGRWEFVGSVAEDKVRRKYIGRSVAAYLKPGAQNPIRYVNC